MNARSSIGRSNKCMVLTRVFFLVTEKEKEKERRNRDMFRQ